jgi:putative tryptophan/tyrosine transport system substrate-binding protein
MWYRIVGGLVTLAFGMLAAPLAAPAQQAGKTYRIVIVHPALPVADLTEAGPRPYQALFSELHRLGYVEGQNLTVERRSAAGRTERFPELAQEVVQLQPDLIIAVSSRFIRHLKAATATTPIVGLTGDPVAAGIVASLARPGGNITGFTATPGDAIFGKYLELLHEAAPRAARVAFLAPRESWEGRDGRGTREAARLVGVMLVGVPLSAPIQEPEYRRAFAVMAREGVEALIVSNDPEHFAHRQVIVELAAQAHLPTIYSSRDFVEIGGLMAYGPSGPDLLRGVATYVDKILKGAKPADLPYQQPTKFELVINLKTAQALGLTIPPLVLLRADEVIQ